MAKRILSILLLALCFGLIVASPLQMAVPFLNQKALFGVLPESKRPAFALRDVMTEKFQRELVAWFDQHYGLRPTATRIDNSLNLHVFGELPPDQPVKVGRGGVLFLDDQVGAYNRQDDPRATIESFAKNLRAAQDLLAPRGKYLVLMVLPSKPTIYADVFPAAWKLPLPVPRPCDANVYEAFVRELRREGVVFVDGRELVERELGRPLRDRSYSVMGRHLNAPPTCRILDEALTLARPHLPDADIPRLDCAYEMVAPDGIDGEEFDLLRVANVWVPRPRAPIPKMVTVPEPTDSGPRPETLVVGSSFAWRTVFEGERNHAFGPTHMLYYNRTVVPRDGRPFYAVPPVHSSAWRSLVLDTRLYLLPTPEEYLPDNNADFVAQLVEALRKGEDER